MGDSSYVSESTFIIDLLNTTTGRPNVTSTRPSTTTTRRTTTRPRTTTPSLPVDEYKFYNFLDELAGFLMWTGLVFALFIVGYIFVQYVLPWIKLKLGTSPPATPDVPRGTRMQFLGESATAGAAAGASAAGTMGMSVLQAPRYGPKPIVVVTKPSPVRRLPQNVPPPQTDPANRLQVPEDPHDTIDEYIAVQMSPQHQQQQRNIQTVRAEFHQSSGSLSSLHQLGRSEDRGTSTPK